MNNIPSALGCGCCRMSRRRFLHTGGALCCAAGLSAPALLAERPGNKVRIRVVYSLHAPVQDRPDWPNIGFDFVPVMKRITTELQRERSDFEFLVSTASGEEDARKILSEDASKEIDGYVVWQMNCWNRVVQTIASSGKPVLYADFLFAGSGGFLVYTAGFLRKPQPNVGFMASSRLSDVSAALKCFEAVKKTGRTSDFGAAVAKVRFSDTPQRGDLTCSPDSMSTLSTEDCLQGMKQSKILAVRDQNSGPADPVMTIPVERVSFAEVNDAWKAADRDESRAVAAKWQRDADRVAGVSQETLETSAAMYLGMKSVLKRHGANAITVNCLGGFYGGHIHAYPCLGFHQLCNEGLIGACECDVPSTATMVAITTMTKGRPGYISDPVIDTAKRQIIYAHCVASNRVFGPGGSDNPFEILTHSEDRQGASVRSVMPLGFMTTTLRVDQAKKQIVFHQGKSVANDPEDRACRTKLCAEPVGDIEKLFTQWDRFGWHRVTFYGDLKQPVFALADRLGWTVQEEA